MFHTRYTLYLQAYQHKIVNIIEEKLLLFLLLLSFFKIYSLLLLELCTVLWD